MTDDNDFSPPSSIELPPEQLSVIAIQIPVVGITMPDGQLLLDNRPLGDGVAVS